VRFVGLDPIRHAPDGVDLVGWVEPRLAEHVLRWHDDEAVKVAWWGGVPHTCVGDARSVVVPPHTATHRNAGSRVREALGPRYVSIGVTFDHGVVAVGGAHHTIDAPRDDDTERWLRVTVRPYLLDLRQPAPLPVAAWLDEPATLRLVGPRFDPAAPDRARMQDGALRRWFDAIAHIDAVTPTTELADPRGPRLNPHGAGT
jgi:erythromycin esterase